MKKSNWNEKVKLSENSILNSIQPQESTDRQNLAYSDPIWPGLQDYHSITLKTGLAWLKAKSMLHSIVYLHGNYSLPRILQCDEFVSFTSENSYFFPPKERQIMATKYNIRDDGNFVEIKLKPMFIHKNLKAVSHNIIIVDFKNP